MNLCEMSQVSESGVRCTQNWFQTYTHVHEVLRSSRNSSRGPAAIKRARPLVQNIYLSRLQWLASRCDKIDQSQEWLAICMRTATECPRVLIFTSDVPIITILILALSSACLAPSAVRHTDSQGCGTR